MQDRYFIFHNIKHNFRQSIFNTVEGYQTVSTIRAGRLYNKKHLKNVRPIHHCEPPHAACSILHCHSPGVATVDTTTKMSRSQL